MTADSQNEPEKGQIVLYQTEDGSSRIECRFEGETLWLSLNQMADLFGRDKSVISKHLKSIFEDGELAREATVAKYATVQTEGNRQVEREIEYYSLEAIFAVGYRVRKQDIIIAKNYLSEDEVDTLNRLVVIFLEQAELRAKQQKELTLDFWRSSVDRMLSSNDQPLLDGPGSVSHEAMKTIANERYDDFDVKRRKQEVLEADAEDLKAIEDLEKDLKRKGGKS